MASSDKGPGSGIPGFVGVVALPPCAFNAVPVQRDARALRLLKRSRHIRHWPFSGFH